MTHFRTSTNSLFRKFLLKPKVNQSFQINAMPSSLLFNGAQEFYINRHGERDCEVNVWDIGIEVREIMGIPEFTHRLICRGL